MSRAIFILMIALASGLVRAAGNDPSEKGVHKSPLHIYSGGAGAGVFAALNKDLQNESEQWLKISQTNLLKIRNNVGMFIDLDAYFPTFSWGANLGFDFFLGSPQFSALVGLGAGFNHFEKDEPFGKEIGASGTAHVGFILGLTESTKVRMRVPYTFVTNDPRDNLVGLDISLLISSRWSHVKKLNYQ